jgi:hypothetical protein
VQGAEEGRALSDLGGEIEHHLHRPAHRLEFLDAELHPRAQLAQPMLSIAMIVMWLLVERVEEGYP